MENKENEKQEEKQPDIVRVFGKEFDISTPEGRIQLEAWDEAMRTMQGKQANELGELRKFKKKLEPALDNQELKKKVRELQEEGNNEDVVELLLANSAKMIGDFRDSLKTERENDKAWSKYFKSRPELLKTFDEDLIRSYSEQNLGIFDAENPFEVLDAYWGPKAKSQKDFDSSERVETQSSADVTKVTRPVREKAEKETPAPTVDDIFKELKL